MEIELSQRQIDAIAYRVALIVAKRLQEQDDRPEMVSTKEAAAILHITPARMRQIADRFPHVKQGDNPQGKLLFVRKSLLEQY